jgi:hypothetical protein
MNYLTNYYRNLCEQLQEKINILEARIRSPQEMYQIGSAEMQGQTKPTAVNSGYSPWARRAERRQALINNAMAQMGDVAMTGDVKTARQVGDVMADIAKTGEKVAGGPQFGPPDEEFVGVDPTRDEMGFEIKPIDHGNSEREAAEVARKARESGKAVVVPSDIAAMRKFIQMGRGRYQAPFPQPPTTPHHSSNATY